MRTHSQLTWAQTVEAFVEVVEAYEFSGAVFVAHSFGCAVTSWLVQHAPQYVEGVVLLDPVVFCIHLRKLLFNFGVQLQVLRSARTHASVCALP